MAGCVLIKKRGMYMFTHMLCDTLWPGENRLILMKWAESNLQPLPEKAGN